MAQVPHMSHGKYCGCYACTLAMATCRCCMAAMAAACCPSGQLPPHLPWQAGPRRVSTTEQVVVFFSLPSLIIIAP